MPRDFRTSVAMQMDTENIVNFERNARQSLAKSDQNVPNSDLQETNRRTSQSVTVPKDKRLMIAGMNTSHRADCEPHSQGAIH